MLSLPLAAATTIAIENHKADARSRSMQWNWGLDGYNAPEWHQLRRGDAEQQVTRNALNRMLTGPGEPHFTQSWMPKHHCAPGRGHRCGARVAGVDIE